MPFILDYCDLNWVVLSNTDMVRNMNVNNISLQCTEHHGRIRTQKSNKDAT